MKGQRKSLFEAVRLSLVLFLLLSLPKPAGARVFQFKNENIGTYLHFDTSYSNVQHSPYDPLTATSLTYSDQGVEHHLGGEIGLLLGVQQFSFRLGVEALRGKKIAGLFAKNSSGDNLFSINNEILAFSPVFHMEYSFYQTKKARAYFSAGLGQAQVNLTNEFSFTSAGQTAFPGVSDYNEKASATASTWAASFGYEFVLADTTTMTIYSGYRSMTATNFTYSEPVAADINNQSHSKGDPLLWSDNTKRTLDLSHYFVGLGLRFYIDIR